MCAADADPEVRFIAASAFVGSGFSRLSLAVEYGLSWHLPQIMGTARVSDFLLSGHAVSATEAAELGLVNQMITDDDVLDHAVLVAGWTVGFPGTGHHPSDAQIRALYADTSARSLPGL
ncbi:enoyl-CoA hydratase-related protein, partial [Frankia sp. KB5]|uniref:enoyl-CoA hydratase-related protein n=1 Tax=Frankia sp. KB5 TaxID=683318 RepID=UPI00321F8233